MESVAFLSPKSTDSRNKTDITKDPKLCQQQQHQQPLYGDIVGLLLGSIGTLFYIFETCFVWRSTGANDETTKKLALQFLGLWIWPLFFYVPSILYHNLWCSRIAMLGVVYMQAHTNIVQYPYPGECTITMAYQCQVVFAVLANISLSFGEKMARLGLLFVVGSYVSITSPYSAYFKDTFPILGGTILLAVFVLHVYHFSVAREYATVQAARSVLAFLFFYHTIANLPGFGSPTGGASDMLLPLLKALVLASIGVAATGTFQQEVLQKEQLEILVKQRTQKLHMVNLALQASETAIVITDNAGSIVWVNRAFETLCGATESALVGRKVSEALHDNMDPGENTPWAALESKEGSTKEAELRIGDSIYAYESTPFPEEHDDVTGDKTNSNNKNNNNRFLMVFKNITAGRAREAAEQEAQDKAMMAKAMGDSMVTLTHELRTPLQGIMGITSLLLQGNDLGTDAMESIKLIMASSTLLLNLINNLLDVKKATAKMLEDFPLSPVPAGVPIQDAIVFAKPLASISDVEVAEDLGLAPHAIVLSNSLRLQQVLINLVSNAIKYTAKGSTITIRTFESTVADVHTKIDHALASSRTTTSQGPKASDNDDSVSSRHQRVLVFSVSDHGPGIQPSQAHRLFRRFAQLENNPSSRQLGSSKIGQPSGTGLGLHLCQLFVQRMNGHIWATNNHNSSGKDGGAGSTFFFSLPLISNELPHNTATNNHSSSGTAESTANGVVTKGSPLGVAGKLGNASLVSLSTLDGSVMTSEDMQLVYEQRILFVDDTLINRKVLSRILKKVGFSNVTTVDSGEAALEELSSTNKTTEENKEEQPYDLVISDLQMPGMSGTELSEAIAANEGDSAFHTKRPVVVGLTADTSMDVAERCRRSGMSDVLYKPITAREVKKYAETVILSLRPGVWHSDRGGSAAAEEREAFGFGGSAETTLPVQ